MKTLEIPKAKYYSALKEVLDTLIEEDRPAKPVKRFCKVSAKECRAVEKKLKVLRKVMHRVANEYDRIEALLDDRKMNKADKKWYETRERELANLLEAANIF